MAWGEYPVEYNPKVHGPYDPARFYGKADLPLAKVKVGELGEWIGRRNLGPSGIAGGLSRAFWRWQHKYVQPKKTGIAPFFQVVATAMVVFYALNYGKLKHHRNQKHHW